MQRDPHIQAKYDAANPDWIAPKLDVIDPCSFQGQGVPERQWLVESWIPLRAVSILGGDGGVGKSVIAQQLSTAVVTGGSWLGLPVMRCKALYVSCEDEKDELHRRQEPINRSLGIDYADLDGLEWVDRVGEDNLLFAYTETRTGGRGPLDTTDLYCSILRHALHTGAQLITLDSLHDFYGGNENSRSEVRRFMQMLTAIAREINGAVVLLAHPSLSGRSTGTGESGSTAWNAAVRSRLYLSHPPDEDGVSVDANERLLTRKKANYAAAGDTVRLQWVDGTFVSKDTGKGIVASLDRKHAETVFLDLLAQRETEGRTVSDNNHSGNYAPAQFARHPRREGFRKADFQWAMETLFSEGRIKVVKRGPRPSREFDTIVAVPEA